ncbi:hypothetical protein ACP4OV_023302 [Aristida adscensionis]
MAVDASELLLPARYATEIKRSYVTGECVVDDHASPPCPHDVVLPCCAPFCVPPATATATETGAAFFAGDAVPSSTMSRKRARAEEQALVAAAAHGKRRVLGGHYNHHPAVVEHARAQVEKTNSAAAAQQRRRHEAARVLTAAKAEWVRAKDEELARARWLAWALQARLRAACAEARAWRAAALAGEAVAAALHADLGHALRADADADADADVLVEDAGSCCYGDNDGGGGGVDHGSAASPWGACRGCGERAAAVLVLPCRHLSACAPCAGAAAACPACGSSKVGSVAVNLI